MGAHFLIKDGGGVNLLFGAQLIYRVLNVFENHLHECARTWFVKMTSNGLLTGSII